jgi:uncharacterized protein YegL
MVVIPDDLRLNRQQRCPLVLLLDTSSSMGGKRIEALNDALKSFKAEILQDPVAALRVDLAVVAFGSSEFVVEDFRSIDSFDPPTLSANGWRAMGTAMDLALEMIHRRKLVYRASGVRYYRPLIWIMTAGSPEDTTWKQAARRAREAESRREVVVFPIGIGDEVDMSLLKELSSHSPVRISSGLFAQLFQWLSASVRVQATSLTTSRSEISGSVTSGSMDASDAIIKHEIPDVAAAAEQIKFSPVDWETEESSSMQCAHPGVEEKVNFNQGGRIDPGSPTRLPTQDVRASLSAHQAAFSIFLCYRHSDSEQLVHRMHECLVKSFGANRVFIDTNIPPGTNYKKILDRKIRECSVALVVVGPSWMAETNAAGRPRIFDSEDYVRREIEAALANDSRIIPVLWGKATPPEASDLPSTISEFADLQVHYLDHKQHFPYYMGRLIRRLKEIERSWRGF